ncbi:LacI family DNA-binding transcriptional regulator [Glycomyces scopariae]
MATGAGPRRSRGEIERLPSGSLRVRVYDGLDPLTRRRRYLVETVAAGPGAEDEAERVRTGLLARAEERRGVADEKPLTVAAVARLAGVSAPTVSKVLNGRAGVAPETRRRVERLLREQGYRRPEKTARAASLEVLFYGLQAHVGVDLMRGVKRVAAEHGLAVAFTDALQEESTGRDWAREILDRRPAGVVVAHMGFTPEQHAILGASGIPLVAVDPPSEPLHPVPAVAAANRQGGADAARHLLDLGHRRVGVVTGPLERLCSRDRLDGARTALAAAGAPLDERLVRTGMWFSYEEGLAHGRDLLGLADPPTAVLCGNDLQALGVYEAARQAGAAVPADLSVVGFDDISYTRWCGPPMTTVRQPFAELGAAAAGMVLALAAGEAVAQSRVELPVSLTVRASTAAPRAATSGR